MIKTKFQIESNVIATGLSKDNANAAANGATVDQALLVNGPYEAATLVAEVEAVTGTPSAFDLRFTIEHSANGSAWSQVTGDAIESNELAFTAVGVKTLGIRLPALKGYLRARLATCSFTGGTSPAAKVRAFLVLTEPRQA